MKSTFKIFALIAAIALTQGPRALALSSGETMGASTQVAAAQSGKAPERSKNVDLELEVLPSAMSGNPNLLVQLQDADAVDAAGPAFAGLEPGVHTARVILMDEQNQPLEGGVAMVHFRVHDASVPPLTAAAPPQELQGAPLPPPVPAELSGSGDTIIPTRNSPLLLVSIIGFALLIGGILPGIRARKMAVHP